MQTLHSEQQRRGGGGFSERFCLPVKFESRIERDGQTLHLEACPKPGYLPQLPQHSACKYSVIQMNLVNDCTQPLTELIWTRKLTECRESSQKVDRISMQIDSANRASEVCKLQLAP